MKEKQSNIELSNLAVIILSTVGLIYTLVITNKPLTVSTEFAKLQSFSVNDYYQIFIPGNSTCNKVNEKANKCEIKISKSDAESFVEDLNKQKLYDISAIHSSGQIIISHLQGKRIELKRKVKDESTTQAAIDASEDRYETIPTKIINTPMEHLKLYFTKLTVALISFLMVFYLMRDAFFNSGKKLELKIDKLKDNLNKELKNIQEMDRHIYLESLHSLTVSNDDILTKYENSNPDEVLVISEKLESDIKDEELQRQVIKNLKNGIYYTWILSDQLHGKPIEKLLKSFKNLDSDIDRYFKCIKFYMINAKKLKLLPYELNFYSYDTKKVENNYTQHITQVLANNKKDFKKENLDTQDEARLKLIAFEKNNNLDLTNCVDVDEIYGIVSGWIKKCNKQQWVRFETCSNNKIKVSITSKDSGNNILIYTEQ